MGLGKEPIGCRGGMSHGLALPGAEAVTAFGPLERALDNLARCALIA